MPLTEANIKRHDGCDMDGSIKLRMQYAIDGLYRSLCACKAWTGSKDGAPSWKMQFAISAENFPRHLHGDIWMKDSGP